MRSLTTRRADWLGIALLAVLWIAMSVLVDPIADFPINDDWIYAGSAKSIVEHGYFWIPGPAIPNLLPQAYWGALFCLPFGFSFNALRLSILVLGLAGVLGLYATPRTLGAAPRLALIGAAALAANPLWFNVAICFMTDVPFISVTILAILCLVRGEVRHSAAATVLGLGLALLAVMIRQTGLFLLFGYAVAYPLSRGWRAAVLIRGVLPLLLAVALHMTFQHWLIATGRAPDLVMSTASSLIPKSFPGFIVASIRACIVLVPYLGACVFPFVILTRPVTPPGVTPGRERAVRIGLLLLAALFLAWIEWKDDGMPVLTNLMYSVGIGPLTLRDALRLHINLPVEPPAAAWMWLAANTIGVAGGVLLLDRLVRALIAVWSARGRPARFFTLMVVTAATYWAAILALDYWQVQYFDRYILGLLPFAILAVMATPGLTLARDRVAARTALAVGCLLVYAAFGVIGSHDYIAWNRARWRALGDLVEVRHVPPERIDGGYEFNGWMYHDPRFSRPHQTDYWMGDPGQAYALAFGPMAGYAEVGRYPVERWLDTTYGAVLVLHRNDAAW